MRCGGVRGIDVAGPCFPVLARRVCCSGPCHAVKSSGCNGHSADPAWGAVYRSVPTLCATD